MSLPAWRDNIIPVSALEGFRLWSPSYDTEPNPLLSLEQRSLAHKLDDAAGKTFLDVACGTGRWMSYAAEKGAITVGVDLSADMLALAREKGLGSLLRGDAVCLPLADKVADITVCSFSIAYVQDRKKLLEELRRVTRTGGIVRVSDFHPATGRKGWRRTFRRGSDLFEVRNYSYGLEELLGFACSGGLELRELLELRFGEPELRIMRSAGKEDWIDQVTSLPAVLVVEWECR